ncbi:hypothetical protein CFIMG_007988RA00001 [Ceratocystis fimbriata CBS 114723]|uniref:Uncharacterized protein n=1 Tax=Ceratocystis fimbriata CBS 114723 TaxID=1035309 RepID=A0A2C5WSA2_9PEZI|nr:hypothetical protein CFIMG_007988RA00001 [Ceratocystis fimbriata CBS 114723]
MANSTTDSTQLHSVRDWPKFVGDLKWFATECNVWGNIDPAANPRTPWAEEPKEPSAPEEIPAPTLPPNATLVHDEDWENVTRADAEEEARRARMPARQRARLEEAEPIPTRVRFSNHERLLACHARTIETTTRAHESQINQFRLKWDLFRDQRERIDKVRAWINKHISPPLATQVREEYWPDKMVDKLMDVLKVTTANLESVAYHIYREAMRKLNVLPQDNNIHRWISEWQTDIQFCQQNYPSQENSGRRLWDDFSDNLAKTLNGWKNSYTATHGSQLARGNMDIDDVVENIKAWHELGAGGIDADLVFTSVERNRSKSIGGRATAQRDFCVFCKAKHPSNKCRLWVKENRYKSYRIDKRRQAYVEKYVAVPGHPLALELERVVATGGFKIDPEMGKDRYSKTAGRSDSSAGLEAMRKEADERAKKRCP